MKKYIVKFVYSGCDKPEYFSMVFETSDINKAIAEYVKEQNKGEAKSDRIWYHSKELITH